MMPAEVNISGPQMHAIVQALVHDGVKSVDSTDAYIARAMEEAEFEGASVMCMIERCIEYYSANLFVGYTVEDDVSPTELWMVGTFPLKNLSTNSVA